MQDVKTKFSVNEGDKKRTEYGKVLRVRPKNKATKIIEVELDSRTGKEGTLEINNTDLNAKGSRKICEYEVSKDVGSLPEEFVGSGNNETPSVSFNEERTLVHTEIENIKNCRASLFMGTLGILGAAGIAILGILGTKGGSIGLLAWLPCAAAIPALLLTAAIITITHKARGLNERQGYLEAIEEIKNSGSQKDIRSIKGWILAKSSSRMCKILRDAENRVSYPMTIWGEVQWRLRRLFKGKIQKPVDATQNYSPCMANKDEFRCTDEAKEEASKINRLVWLFPNMYNSFTSVCTCIYSIAYCISMAVLLWSVFKAINLTLAEKGAGNEVNFILFWSAVAVASGIVWLRACFKERISKWIPVVFLLLAMFFVAGSFGRPASWLILRAYGLGYFVAFLTSVVAYNSLKKVDSLRRGRHSIDHWRHVWKIRIKRCPLMDTQYLNKDPFVEIWERKYDR